MFFKTGDLKNFANVHKKTLVLESLFQRRHIPVNIVKFIRTAFVIETSGYFRVDHNIYFE